MAKIFLFRHGQTTFNEHNLFNGWLESDLDPAGIEEAKKIGEELKDQPVTKAYCSDLRRSKHTLELVLNGYHKHVQVIIDPRLRERDYGELSGKSKFKTEKEFPKEYQLWHRSWDVRPPGGESIADVAKRVLPFIHNMLKDLKPNDVVLISAHGNSMRPIRKYFEHMSNEDAATFEHPLGKVYEYHV